MNIRNLARKLFSVKSGWTRFSRGQKSFYKGTKENKLSGENDPLCKIKNVSYSKLEDDSFILHCEVPYYIDGELYFVKQNIPLKKRMKNISEKILLS